MRLRILLPERVLFDAEVTRCEVEGREGRFCCLPRRRDLVAALVPGICEVGFADQARRLLAIDEGVLVKAGDEVSMAVRDGVVGGGLGELEGIVRGRFHQRAEQESAVRTAAARLEASLVRRFMEVGGG